MTIDINNYSLEDLRDAFVRKQSESVSELQKKRQTEEERLQAEAAVGKEEAVSKCAYLVESIQESLDEIERLSRKHLLYITLSLGDASMSFTRWGRDYDGWDSSSC